MAHRITRRGKWAIALIVTLVVGGSIWLTFHLDDDRTAVGAWVLARLRGVEPVPSLGAAGYPSVAWSVEEEPGPREKLGDGLELEQVSEGHASHVHPPVEGAERAVQ